MAILGNSPIIDIVHIKSQYEVYSYDSESFFEFEPWYQVKNPGMSKISG